MAAFLGASLGGLPLAFAGDPSLQNCTKYATVGGDSLDNGTSVISSKPSKICSVECYATGANGYVAIWDSPDGTTSHGQAQIAEELGAATAGNSASSGKIDRYTNYGLVVDTGNCRATLSYVD